MQGEKSSLVQSKQEYAYMLHVDAKYIFANVI